MKIAKDLVLCENMKILITDSIESDELMIMTFSFYLSNKLSKKYSYLSKIFMKEYHVSISDYTNSVKMDRIKKLIDEHDLSMNEISVKMHYSSPSHLSHQFKSIVKCTPLEYKNLTT